jgi:5'-AMP-activated protein kinase catalytic alpha subunit
MSELNLSKVEIPLHSKSMSNHESPKFDLISIKQIGDYILGEEIGSGAFGKVLLGRHILTEEKVAIKVLDKSILNQTPEDYELVMKEISILKLVKHKYIVQLYEILQTAQHIFIIMEYCEGKEILDYILQKTKLTELESLKYFQQLINCLFYLHSQNIAHRDVKIDNMLLDSNKDLKLIDFGLSTKYTDDDLLDQPCGTVVYAAPEVLEGKEYHGMLADVWSSGIVLYGMLAGYLPFSDKDDEVNKKQVIKGQIKMPEFLSDSVKDLLKHMLDVNPMTRYTLQEIKDHPWFNTVECVLIPGIIIDYNIIPIDDKIINLCVTYNKDKNDVINSIINNKHDSNSALYYLLIKKLLKKGIHSISDMCSDEFIDFVLDDNNLINKENDDNKEEKKRNFRRK